MFRIFSKKRHILIVLAWASISSCNSGSEVSEQTVETVPAETNSTDGDALTQNPIASELAKVEKSNASFIEGKCSSRNRPQISSREYALDRPQDFYAACFERDLEICQAAEKLLNKFPRPKPTHKIDRITYSAIGADLWEGYNSIPFRGDFIKADKLDFFNNGEIRAVFQTQVGLGGVKVPTLYVSEPILETDDISLDVDFFLSERNSQAEISPTNLSPIFPHEYWWAGSSIARIHNRNYVAFFVPADSFSVGRAAIIEMSDRNIGEYVCTFQARYEVVKDQTEGAN